jgi:predicted RNA binding protein YcfA (HicA-like mRNA interferase family)
MQSSRTRSGWARRRAPGPWSPPPRRSRPFALGRPRRYLRWSPVPATQKEWIKHLQRQGWTLERGGKHQVKMTKPGHRPITLPEHKGRAYSKGFEAELRRQAGLQDR